MREEVGVGLLQMMENVGRALAARARRWASCSPSVGHEPRGPAARQLAVLRRLNDAPC